MENPLFEMRPFKYYPCHLEVFLIRGIKAKQMDFGENIDVDSDNAMRWCCSCMKFIPDDSPQNGILEKYNISMDEWKIICSELERILCVWRCSWCE